MEIIEEIYKVLRLLMRLLDQAWKCSIRKDSNLLVLLSKETHPSDKLTCTIAAAGPWAPSNPIESVLDETLSLLQLTASLPVSASVCKSVDTEELSLFVNSSGPLHFFLAFQSFSRKVHPCWEQERLCIEAFLHRISLVRAQMRVFLKFKENGKTHQHIYGDTVSSKMLLHNQRIIMDSTSYQLCPFSEGGLLACEQMHAVVGTEVPLQLLPQLLEAGLGGEASIITMAALGPCMDQYPNWPTRLATIQVLVYSPCCMPLREALSATPLSFLQALAGRLAWRELGLSGVACADQKQMEERASPGSRGPRLCCDMVFHVEDGERVQESKWSPTVKQTLTLFLLVNHSDPFHSQLSDVMASEEMLEKHLDEILWHNSDRVVTSVQSLLEKALKPYQKKCLNQQKMQSALSVILSSITSVVNSSSSAEFRSACLNKMQVEDTHQLASSLDQSLHSVTGVRFTPFNRCTTTKKLGAGNNTSVHRPEGEDGTQAQGEGDTDCQTRLVSCTVKRQQTAPSADETPHCKQRLTEAFQDQENLPTSSGQSQLSVRSTASVTLTTDGPTHTKQEDPQWLQAIEDISQWD